MTPQPVHARSISGAGVRAYRIRRDNQSLLSNACSSPAVQTARDFTLGNALLKFCLRDTTGCGRSLASLGVTLELRICGTSRKAVVILESLLMLPGRRCRVVTICAPVPRLQDESASEVAKIDGETNNSLNEEP